MSLSSEIEWTWQSNYRFIEGRARNSCWKDCAVVIFRLYIKTILKLCDRPSQILFACCWLIPQVIWQQFSILTVIFFVVFFFSHAGCFFPCRVDFHIGLGSFFSVQVTILERMTTRRDWYESPTTCVVFQGFARIQCVRVWVNVALGESRWEKGGERGGSSSASPSLLFFEHPRSLFLTNARRILVV